MQIYFDCNEANYELLLLKTSLCKTLFCQNECLSCMRIKSRFHIDGFALSPALKQRLWAI